MSQWVVGHFTYTFLPRFADLPKRETTYRLAKNLDAVSRKAMEVYATSEMFQERGRAGKGGKRRKSVSTKLALWWLERCCVFH